jgi:hypothetical protein
MKDLRHWFLQPNKFTVLYTKNTSTTKYLGPLQIRRVHEGAMKILDLGVSPLQQALKLQVRFSPALDVRLNGQRPEIFVEKFGSATLEEKRAHLFALLSVRIHKAFETIFYSVVNVHFSGEDT